MVSSALLRSCANTRRSFERSVGSLLDESGMISEMSLQKHKPPGYRMESNSTRRAATTFDSHAPTLDIKGVPSEKADPATSVFPAADMAELADALGSGPSDRKVV